MNGLGTRAGGQHPGCSFGFVTGAQAANTVCLAAARHRVLADVGWDVELDGLVGSPKVRVLASEERHTTIDRSLRLLGFGAGGLETIPADANGAIDVTALRAWRGPTRGVVLVRFGDDDGVTDRVMRISVSNWRTTEADVDRSVRAVVTAYEAVCA